MKSPSLDSNSQKIDKLVRRINDGDIKVPAFQRGYVWKQEQIIDLLESVVSEFPIGSILLWEVTSGDKLKSARNIAGYKSPDKPDEYPIHYVLDGQQRLSSIFAVFSDKLVQENQAKQYNPDPDLFEICYDFKQKQFLPAKECQSASDSIIALRDVLNLERFLPAVQKLNPNYVSEAQKLQSKFNNYDIPVVTIKNRSRAEVGKIFERINNTGTKLSLVDLITAWSWTEDFHLLDSANELLEELEDKGFGKLSYKSILQISAAIIAKSTTTDSVLELKPIDLRNKWETICEALKKCIDFLSTELNCKHEEFIPFNQQIVPLSYFFCVCSKPSAEQFKQLKRWFWLTSFSDRYSTGQTTNKMDADLLLMDELSQNVFSTIDKYKFTVTEDDLVATQFSKNNPLTRALLILMSQYHPKDLLTETNIDVVKALSKFNRSEYHHIFPNAYLTKIEVPKTKRFSLMNFCFLTSASNKQISNKKPSEYFDGLFSKTNFSQIMESNLMPVRRELYQQNDFDAFLKGRSAAVLSKIEIITS